MEPDQQSNKVDNTVQYSGDRFSFSRQPLYWPGRRNLALDRNLPYCSFASAPLRKRWSRAHSYILWTRLKQDSDWKDSLWIVGYAWRCGGIIRNADCNRSFHLPTFSISSIWKLPRAKPVQRIKENLEKLTVLVFCLGKQSRFQFAQRRWRS